MHNIQHIFVLGGGTMGREIAELVASKGFEVTLLEKDDQRAEKARAGIEKSLEKKLAKWGITAAEQKSTLSRIRFSSDRELLKEADLVIETVTEDLSVKQEVFEYCDQLCRPEVILSSNTSTLSLTEIASVTKRPDRVIGLHFVYPVTRRPVVEVIRGLLTSDQTVEAIQSFLPSLELEGIEVIESPGFVTTRLHVLLINESFHLLQEGVASAEEIDQAMKLGHQFPMGPLEMADRFGLDAVLAALESLHREFGTNKYRPATLLRKMVRAGQVGTKVGQGVFRYNNDGERLPSEGVVRV